MEQDSKQLEDRIVEESNIDWMDLFDRVYRKYTDDVMRDLVRAEFDKQIVHIRRWRNGVYESNDLLRSKGVPFAERQKMINRDRLKFCDEYEARMIRDVQVFKIRPLHQWFTVDDYWEAKKYGMGRVIRFRFDDIYYVPNQK